jgi:hypothetical protein
MRSTTASLAPDPPIVILPRLGAHDGNDASQAARSIGETTYFRPRSSASRPMPGPRPLYLFGSVRY